ncbi:MAG: hypothetical protein F6J87_16310 [Spirulina sp. SIO3F2]|nr:hypothetical protein [Spirulina sp. SIO3F2]
MEQAQPTTHSDLSSQLTDLEHQILSIAQTQANDCLEILALLRLLNQLHQQIRDELFYPALPDNRHGLAQVLRNIEETGGWPSIERVRLQAFLANLEWQSPSAPEQSQ